MLRHVRRVGWFRCWLIGVVLSVVLSASFAWLHGLVRVIRGGSYEARGRRLTS